MVPGLVWKRLQSTSCSIPDAARISYYMLRVRTEITLATLSHTNQTGYPFEGFIFNQALHKSSCSSGLMAAIRAGGRCCCRLVQERAFAEIPKTAERPGTLRLSAGEIGMQTANYAANRFTVFSAPALRSVRR